MDEKEILKRKLAREQRARQSAENILEAKSRELYFLNKELEKDRLSLFENASVGIALSVNGKYTNANSKYCAMLGYSLDELSAMSIADTLYQADRANLQTHFETVNKKKESYTSVSKRYLRKDNSVFWGQLHIAPVYREDGSLKYHLSILEDIQDQKNAESKQAALLSELKRSNTELEAFAQMVSHDLKSPLKGVRTLFEWLKDDYSELYNAEAKENLVAIEERLDKMTGLIDGIMRYTKVSDEGEEDEVALGKVVDTVIQFVFKPAHVVIKKTGSYPTLLCNRHKMHQLFQNLIDNAVKFCNEETGIVEVKGSEDDDFFIFKVADNGKGIPEKYHNKIFKIFTTLENDPKNTGIGLSIVKNIVNQYGGKIFVSSEIGRGAEFTFTLAKTAFH